MYKVALWGMGYGYNFFTQLHGHEMVEVVAIADNWKRGLKSIDGIPVISPQELGGYPLII